MRRFTAATILTALSAAGVGAQQEAARPDRVTLAVVGGALLDGNGGPARHNAVVLVSGDRIVAVGDEGRLAVPAGAQLVDAHGFTVMPGLIDTHVHLDYLGHGDYATWHRMVEGEYADVMRLSAAQLLAHGITTALDATGELKASIETRERIARGEIKGPRMLVSGGWIQNWPDEQAARYPRQKHTFNAHTTDEARQAARTLLDGGVDHIKMYTGVTVDQVKAVAAEAHKRRKLVGAHVYTDEEIQTAIKGGVDILHHAGSGHQNPQYTEETLRMMVESRVAIGQSIAHRVALYPSHVEWPERLDNPDLRRELGKYADAVLGSLRDFPSLPYFSDIQRQMRIAPRATRQLYEAGCRLIMGTDSGTVGNFHSESVWREMEALVRIEGIAPGEVITATTRNAAAALRVNTGAIVPGRLADIILIKGNPLEHMVYMQNVALVIKGGVLQSAGWTTQTTSR